MNSRIDDGFGKEFSIQALKKIHYWASSSNSSGRSDTASSVSICKLTKDKKWRFSSRLHLIVMKIQHDFFQNTLILVARYRKSYDKWVLSVIFASPDKALHQAHPKLECLFHPKQNNRARWLSHYGDTSQARNARFHGPTGSSSCNTSTTASITFCAYSSNISSFRAFMIYWTHIKPNLFLG